MPLRRTRINRTLHGGCYVCHQSEAHWFGLNTQGVVARHHDATGHKTWVEVTTCFTYGDDEDQPNDPH